MMELMFQMNRSISLFFIICVCVLVVQSCLTLCDAMNRSPPGSSIHGLLQARILEWIAIPFSTGSGPGLLHHRQILYHLSYREVLFIIY